MFGHHSLSETSFATDAIDLFFTPTGVSVTGATFSSDYTVNASANVTISQGVLGDIRLLADGNSSFFTTLMGVSGTMDMGTALVWGLVQVDQTPSWSTLESDQTTSYTTLTPSQTPSWEQQKA